MPETPTPPNGDTTPPTIQPGERRRPRARGTPSPHLAAAQYVMRHRLEPFLLAVQGLALAVFGPAATVVPHLRTVSGRRRITFVVDAADPSATTDYSGFLPHERAFWTAYAQLPKPEVPFAVAVRPARGWCRAEALAPFFTHLPTPELEA